ncbi:hypothetical protein [Streptomyces sp. NPDC048636]|uniref:hypothetical protein n=1 Tax=Streptomyces sp. NPDC048636 TaxID=3155762 RepID=UPI00341EB861
MSHWIIIRCDLCGATHSSHAADSVSAVREVMALMSWALARQDGRMIDVCSACTTPRNSPESAGGKRRCSCEGGELFDALGHDRIGHRLANTLLRAGVDNLELLSSLSTRQLLSLDGIGAAGAHHALSRLRPEPERDEAR